MQDFSKESARHNWLRNNLSSGRGVVIEKPSFSGNFGNKRFLHSYGKTEPWQVAVRRFVTQGLLVLALAILNACNNYGLVDKLENPGSTTSSQGGGSGGQFTTNNYIFVSSWTTVGDMSGQPFAVCSGLSGVSRADCACTEAAKLGNLLKSPTHQFRAWLSTSSNNAKCRVLGLADSCSINIPQPWFNTMGQQVVSNFEIFSNIAASLSAAIRYNEGGVDSAPDLVWTGTNSDGTQSAGFLCVDWTSNASSVNGRVGSRSATDGTWTSQDYQGCETSQRIYCLSMP